MIERAIEIAVSAHKGQVDKIGVPYILHPLRLVARAETPEEIQVAALHDVVEDTEWTLEMLRAEGFSADVVAAIEALTRKEGEVYLKEYLPRIKCNPLARKVKAYDLADNLSESRMNNIVDEEQRAGMRRRYLRAQAILSE